MLINAAWKRIRLISISAGIIEAGFMIGYTFVIGRLVEAAVTKTYLDLIIFSAVGLGIFITQRIVSTFYEYLMAKWLPSYRAHTSRLLFTNWFRIVPKRQMEQGKLNNAIFNDLTTVVSIEQLATYKLAHSFALVLAAAGILFWVHWAVALVTIGALVLSVLFSLPFGSIAERKGAELSKLYEEFWSQSQATAANKLQYLLTRLLGRYHQAMMNRYERLKTQHAKIAFKLAFLQQVLNVFTYFSFFAPIIVAALLYGAQNITPGGIAIVVLLADKLSSVDNDVAESLASLFRIRTIKAKYTARSVQMIETLGYRNFQAVLPEGILSQNPLTLTLAPGTKYLFKGPNGIGKSTTLNVVDRPIQFEGELIINGTPQTAQTVTQFALVRPMQVASLYKAEAEIREVFDTSQNALYDALAQIFLAETNLNKQSRAARLSQGETQLLSLLHAVALTPSILILDESLVSVAEPLRHKIYEALLSQTTATILLIDHTLPDWLERRFDEITTFSKKALPHTTHHH